MSDTTSEKIVEIKGCVRLIDGCSTWGRETTEGVLPIATETDVRILECYNVTGAAS